MNAMKRRTARLLPLFAMMLGACATAGAVPAAQAPATRSLVPAEDEAEAAIQRIKLARLRAKLLDPAAAGGTAALMQAKAARLRAKLLSQPGVQRGGEPVPTP